LKIVGDQLKIKRIIVQRTLVLVEMFYELGDTAFVIKLVRLLFLFALVLDEDTNTLVKKSLLAQPLRKLFETVNRRLEDACVWTKRDLSTTFRGCAGLLQR